MAMKSREVTAFITPFGLYNFIVMPFDLKTAPATFNRLMDRVLLGAEKYCDSYFNDGSVVSATWEDHVGHLRDVFMRVCKAALTMRLSKCTIGHHKVPLSGHVVGKGQIRPHPKKLQAVVDFPQTQTKSDVWSFLGLAGYYCRFIPDFSRVWNRHITVSRCKHMT